MVQTNIPAATSRGNTVVERSRRRSASGDSRARGSEGASGDDDSVSVEKKAAILPRGVISRVILAASARYFVDSWLRVGYILCADDAESSTDEESEQSQRVHYVLVYGKQLIYLSVSKLFSELTDCTPQHLGLFILNKLLPNRA